jgi:hypothetical protein
MRNSKNQDKSFCIGRFQLELQLKKCLFFKSDSCLSACLPVFFQKVFDNGKLKVKLSSKGFGARANE